ncbi:MAG: hypothetical protein B7Z55_19470, partial [Planctomycetales bacterium 12-60-4]
MVFENVLPQRAAIVVAEPVAEIVAGAAELRQAVDRFHRAGLGMNPQVTAANLQLLACFRRGDLAPRVAVAEVQPTVETPSKAVHAMLLVPFGEAGVEDFTNVGLAVAVGIG